MNDVRLIPRDQIDSQFKLNLENLFASVEAWKAEVSSIGRDLVGLVAFQGRLSEKLSNVLDALELLYSLKERESRVYAYAQFSFLVDTNNQVATANYQSAQKLRANLESVASYLEPELLSLNPEELRNLPDKTLKLTKYQHYFDDLTRRLPYILPDEIEKILAELADPFSGPETIATILLSSDIPFDDAHTFDGQAVSVTSQNVDSFLESPDVHLRRSAWRSQIVGLQQFKNSLAETLLSSIKQTAFKSQLRGYSSTLAAALFEDNINRDVFDNVISCVQDNMTLWARYWGLRRKALDQETFMPPDIWAPLSKEAPSFPYEDGIDIICEAMAPLGEDYTRVLKEGCLQRGWIDVFPTVGKYPGWMSSDEPAGPPFIILHYSDTFLDLSSLAHELGHSMHSYYASQSQPMVYKPYSTLIGEVPSNLHQVLLRAHLMHSRSDRVTRLMIINEAMAFFHRYLLVMPTLARFELELHTRIERGEGISADDLIHLYADLLSPAYGDEVVYDKEEVGIEWAIYLHLYQPFYTFKYTIGIAGAYAIATRILEGDQESGTDYLRFLQAGSSVYPTEALKLMGVDITDQNLIEPTFLVMASMLDELEALL